MTTATTRAPLTDIRILALGRLVGVTGTVAAFTALTYTVWERTHSAAMQAIALLVTFGVVGLLGPLTGQLGDRFDRKKVMIAAEAIGAVFYGGMALAVNRPYLLLGLAFFGAVTEGPFMSSSAAAIPNLAQDPEQLARANGLIGVGRNAGIMVGPMIGGLLLAIAGAAWVFALTVFTSAISILCTSLIRGRMQGDRSEAGDGEDEHGGILAGMRFLLREPVLRRMSLAWFVFIIGMGTTIVSDAPLAESFDAGKVGFGLLIACWGGGSVVGSLVGGRILTPRNEYRWLVMVTLGVCAAAICVGLAPWYALALGALLFMGICDGITVVAEQAIMQRRSPDAVRSRVVAAFEAILSLGFVVAYTVAAPILDWVGPQGVYLLAAATAAGSVLVLLPLLRHAPDPVPGAVVAAEPGPEPSPLR